MRRVVSIFISTIAILAILAGCAGNDSASQDTDTQNEPDDDAAIATMENEIVSLEGEIAILEEEIVTISDLAYSQSQKIGQLNVQIEDKSNEISQLENSIASLNGEIFNLNSTIVELESTIASKDVQIASLEAEIEAATNNSSLQSTIEELESTLVIRDLLLSQKNSTIAQKDSTIASRDDMILTLTSEIEELQQDIAYRDSLAEELNSTIVALQQTIAENEATIVALQGDVDDLSAEIASLQGEIESLQAEIDQMSLDLHPCGPGTAVQMGECLPNPPVWGRIPFANGTNVSAGQTYNGVFSHHDHSYYSVDMWCPDEGEGCPIVAFRAGVVIDFKEDSNANCIDLGYSQDQCNHANYVVLDHGDNTYSSYAHLEQWSVDLSIGETVGRGHQIGTMGNTGWSTGPHLHFSVWDAEFHGIPMFFEGLADISAGTAFVGMEIASNNTNMSSSTPQMSMSEYNCQTHSFAYRGVVINSTLSCNIVELDTEYNLSGHVTFPGRMVVIHQTWGHSSWNHFCVDSDPTTGQFSTSMWWNSSTYEQGDGWMMIQMSDEDSGCYWEGWPESHRLYII